MDVSFRYLYIYGGVALCKKKELIGILKGKGIKVEYLCCDNAGEHMSKLIALFQKEGI